jgi:hypothetical protein
MAMSSLPKTRIFEHELTLPRRAGAGSIEVVDERARRIGRNEDLFRKVNDQIEGVNEAFGTITGTMSLLCECGELDCLEQIELSLDEYRELRADPTRFAVIPGHEIPDVERIVERRPGYFVVAKSEGEAARLVTDLAEQ